MLTIRAGQMAIFEKALQARVADDTIAFLRTEFPAEVRGITEAVLRRRVLQGLAQARRYGIRAESSLRVFVATMFTAGPHFDRHPVVARLLRDSSRDPDDRVDALALELSDRVWEEMAILSGGDLWDGEPEGISEGQCLTA